MNIHSRYNSDQQARNHVQAFVNLKLLEVDLEFGDEIKKLPYDIRREILWLDASSHRQFHENTWPSAEIIVNGEDQYMNIFTMRRCVNRFIDDPMRERFLITSKIYLYPAITFFKQYNLEQIEKDNYIDYRKYVKFTDYVTKMIYYEAGMECDWDLYNLQIYAKKMRVIPVYDFYSVADKLYLFNRGTSLNFKRVDATNGEYLLQLIENIARAGIRIYIRDMTGNTVQFVKQLMKRITIDTHNGRYI